MRFLRVMIPAHDPQVYSCVLCHKTLSGRSRSPAKFRKETSGALAPGDFFPLCRSFFGSSRLHGVHRSVPSCFRGMRTCHVEFEQWCSMFMDEALESAVSHGGGVSKPEHSGMFVILIHALFM